MCNNLLSTLHNYGRKHNCSLRKSMIDKMIVDELIDREKAKKFMITHYPFC